MLSGKITTMHVMDTECMCQRSTYANDIAHVHGELDMVLGVP